MVGVFDGVGGWGDVEVCSGIYSRFIAKKIKELFEQDSSRSLKDLLLDSAKANLHGGSTTAVIAKIEGQE